MSYVRFIVPNIAYPVVRNQRQEETQDGILEADLTQGGSRGPRPGYGRGPAQGGTGRTETPGHGARRPGGGPGAGPSGPLRLHLSGLLSRKTARTFLRAVFTSITFCRRGSSCPGTGYFCRCGRT
ncbi:MAG: hypothetical protein E7465_09070 [Ruminococcaceae bacterium]|nr:hypothetical protein [Oscillospiraceae bacterium]